MTQLTDEIIMQTLQSRTFSGAMMGLVSLVIGAVIMIFAIRTARKNEQNLDYSLMGRKRTNPGAIILSMIAIFFVFVGGCFVMVAHQSNGVVQNHTVSKDVVTGKREGQEKSDSGYYMDFQSAGEKQISSEKYEIYNEGDQVILVLDGSGRVELIYSGKEYEYTEGR